MHGRTRNIRQRPFPGKTYDAKDEVDNLEGRNGAHSTVKVCGQEIPEDFGPEKSFQSGGDLICENSTFRWNLGDGYMPGDR